MKIRSQVGFIFAILIFLPLAANSAGANKLKIVTTLSIPADFAEQIGGDKVEVDAIVKGDADPHTYSAKTSDYEKIENADILIKFGRAGLEPWLEDALSSTGFDNSKVVNIQENLTMEFDSVIGANNPHTWMSPDNAKIMVQTIANAIITEDPANTVYYETNRDIYLAKLDELKARIIEKFAPYSGTKVVVNHPAYMYLFNVIGVVRVDSIENSEGGEPSAAEIAEIIDNMQDQDVTILISNLQRESAYVKQIADDTDAKIVELTPLINEDVDSYIEMIDYNVDELIEGIEGEKVDDGVSMNTVIIISVVTTAVLAGVVLSLRYR